MTNLAGDASVTAVFCYGMLLDPEGWLGDAGLIGPGTVCGRRLDLSSGLGDCPEDPEGILHGAAWRVDERMLAVLDQVEDVPSGLYRRVSAEAEIAGQTVSVILYERVLGIHGCSGAGPSWRDSYVEKIRKGYRRFGLPEDALDAALA